jgi:hypothetical protein
MKNLFNPLHALRSFGALLLVGMSVSVSAQDFNYGWSLDFAVEPSETHIAGQAITDLNDELTHIALINCENGSLNSQQCQQVADSGGQFEMLVDANQDGEFERWSIGVGKLRNGEYAKVLLIQNDTNGEFSQLLLVDSATPGFSALYFQQGIVMWGMCLSCDVLADIVWQQNTYQVSWNANPINARAWSDELLVVDN